MLAVLGSTVENIEKILNENKRKIQMFKLQMIIQKVK